MSITETLSGVLQTFPAGTVVGAYNARSARPGLHGSPTASAVASATVSAAGSLSFSGLTDGDSYVAYAQVSGAHRYLSFTAQVPAGEAAIRGQLPVNILDHEAARDGTTDDSAALAAAVSYAEDLGGGTVFLPRGTYLLSSTALPSNVTLQGEGPLTILKRKAGTAGWLLDAASASNVTVRDLAINGNKTDAASAAGGIRFTGGSDNTVQNVSLTNGAGYGVRVTTSSPRARITDVTVDGYYIGIHLANTSDFALTRCFVRTTTTTASFEGAFYLGTVTDGTITDCVAEANAGHGLWMGDTQNTYNITVTGCRFNGNGTGGGTTLDLRGVTVGGCKDIRFVGCEFNDNQENGVWVGIGGGQPSIRIVFTGCTANNNNNTGQRPGGMGFEILGYSTLTGCHAHYNGSSGGGASNSGCGIYVGAAGATISACQVSHNWSTGIRIAATVNATVSGCRVWNNGQRSAGAHHGISLDGTGAGTCTDIVVTGNRCYDSQATKTQEYGIAVSTSADYFVAVGNSVRGNRNAAGYTDTGAGSNKSVANNLA